MITRLRAERRRASVLASECGWDESALMVIYLKGLSEQLKDELAIRDESASLEELISISIWLDNRLCERVRERGGRLCRVALPLESPASPTPPATPPVSPSSPEELEDAMLLGRAYLSSQERRRRMAQCLCIYCGESGHYIASCPNLLKGRAHQ